MVQICLAAGTGSVKVRYMDLLQTDGDSSLRVLWESDECVDCRRRRRHADSNRGAVLVIRPALEHPAPLTLGRLTHEYELRDELDQSWAVRPLALIRHQGQTKLALEDPGGKSLDQLLDAPAEIGRFLRLAIGIVAAQGQLHQRGLAHKHLKPAHILLNRNNGQVWLTGFSIASRLPSERQAPEPLETVAGTTGAKIQPASLDVDVLLASQASGVVARTVMISAAVKRWNVDPASSPRNAPKGAQDAPLQEPGQCSHLWPPSEITFSAQWRAPT